MSQPIELTLAEQARSVAQLADRLRAAQPARAVECIETHISFVLLAGERAYKIKKAVSLGFLDFTTLALRRHYCEEELRLNRRFAPSLYLGVVPVTAGDAGAEFGGTGAVIDYAVQMRAFAQDALWDRLAARGELAVRHIDALAERLCAFHRDAARCAEGAPFGQPSEVHAPTVETLDALEALLNDAADRSRLDDLRRWEAQAFRSLETTLARRRAAGQVRECHGDLHLGNVAQVDGEPTMFDGLEFNDALRWTDVMSDVGFMAMDLHHHRRPDLAHRFVNAYLERSGDHDGARVLRYHLVYRALVRAKVAALRAAQVPVANRPDQPAVQPAASGPTGARAYLDVALACSRPDSAVLIVTHGFSGSGKTSISAPLLERIGAIRIRSDVERKRLAGLPPHAHTGSALQAGLYSPESTLATHERMRQAATSALLGGFSVILDATFLQRAQRDQARALARSLGVPFVVLDFQADAATLRRRIQERAQAGGDASEADLRVLADQLAHADPLGDDERAEVCGIDAAQALSLDTLGAIGVCLSERLAGLAQRPIAPGQ